MEKELERMVNRYGVTKILEVLTKIFRNNYKKNNAIDRNSFKKTSKQLSKFRKKLIKRFQKEMQNGFS